MGELRCRGRSGADTGNGKDRRIKLVHNDFDMRFNFLNFGIKFSDEFNGMFDFQRFSRHIRTD